jgi:hypothetical protein
LERVNTVFPQFIPVPLTRQLLRHVLVVFVTVPVHTYEGSGLGIACPESVDEGLSHLPEGHEPIFYRNERLKSVECLRGAATAAGRCTWSWWPYSCENKSIRVLDEHGATSETDLEANSAQIAQCPQYGRHCHDAD